MSPIPRHRLRFSALAILLMLVTAIAGCSTIDSTFTPTAGEDGQRVFRVGTLRGQPHLFMPFFYQQFLDDNTQAEVLVFDSSPDVKNALVSGQLDAAVMGVPAMLAGAAAEQDVRLIASSADGGSAIVGRPEIADVTDLRGKRVGYPIGSSQEVILRSTLTQSGIDPDRELILVNLAFSDMANAYASGQIDAFSSAEIGPSLAKLNGAHDVVSPYDTPIGKVNIGLAATQRTIDADPDLVQTIVNAHSDAVAFMDTHRDEWRDRVVGEFGLDPAVAAGAIANTWPRADLSGEYVSQVDALAREMFALDQLPAQPEMSTFVDNTFVESASTTVEPAEDQK
ncbi:Putative aliphatic sulfonates-binding protein [Mycolicibacterium vanbaalenii]|uniref:Aliphatic sulfonates-binding protein n=1 Tax=Mycolicibacterium vanbaalenii TaxID=110539 RepID=A0A5S9RAH2_MYCVN|nr:ABC transporter substrate-binding protein [Mycolicibacterium vanbaalenii]CAA0134975.1 Putative aliphatic sulfonates-binding protein [Mycolicibacterium vanbaalenii]